MIRVLKKGKGEGARNVTSIHRHSSVFFALSALMHLLYLAYLPYLGIHCLSLHTSRAKAKAF